jgi:hypothetical protein
MNASDDVITEIAKQEDKLFDGDFFNLLSRLTETSQAGGDQESARKLADLQSKLVTMTTFGKKIQEQTHEVEEAVRSLQSVGRELTREKLLELVIEAPNDVRLNALVSLARPGMDYAFFQMLSERIDRARSAGRERLIKLRERLLELTREVDRQVEARTVQTKKLLNEILQAKDIPEEMTANLGAVDEFFVNVLNEEMESSRKAGNLDRLGKLQQVIGVLEQASAPPAEFTLIEELLEATDESARRAWLDAHHQEITPQFMDALTSLLAQSQASDDKELLGRLQAAYRSALRYSMEVNLNQ